jgi:hypothetical protein
MMRQVVWHDEIELAMDDVAGKQKESKNHQTQLEYDRV